MYFLKFIHLFNFAKEHAIHMTYTRYTKTDWLIGSWMYRCTLPVFANYSASDPIIIPILYYQHGRAKVSLPRPRFRECYTY